MMDVLSGVVVGVGVTVAGVVIWRVARRKTKGPPGPSVRVEGSLQQLRAVGELSVFKVITKEIVTATDHWFGEKGKRYFEWMVSSKKMAMIIAFDIDFRYDLKSPDFVIREDGVGRYRLTMPKCLYETHIKDVLFYDEQNSRLLPWLLPDLLNRAFGSGFSEHDKNRLIEEAKQQASAQARDLVQRMRSEVQKSARQTLGALAQGFGADEVSFDFGESDIIEMKVDYEAPGGQEQAA